MNRTKLFFKNSFYTILLQVFSTISGIILPLVIIKYYGSEINGLVSSITQFLVYLKLMEAGLSAAATYALYKPLAENDHKKISAIVSAANKFYKKIAVFFTIGVLVFSIIYSFVVAVPISQFETILLIFIMGLSGTLEFLTLSKYRVLLNANQKVYVISIASIIYDILNVAIILIFAYLGVNITITKFVALFAVISRSLILKIYVSKHYKYLNYKEEPDNSALNQRWDALYLQILGALQIGLPIVYLTIFSDNLGIVSVYSVYYMIIGGINNLLGLFSNTLYASFGELIVLKKEESFENAVKDFEYCFYLLITIIFSITFVMIMPFIKVYTMGIVDINYYYPLVGFLFTLNGLLYNLKTPQGMLVIAAGHYKETKWQTTFQGLIIAIIGIPLTIYCGIEGILIALIISNIYRTIDLIIYVPKHIGGDKIKNTLINFGKIFIYTILICLPFIFYKINISSYLEWFKYAILVGIYSVLVVLLGEFIFFRKDLKNVLTRIKRIFRRN
ncbi:MAG: hypothetical protein IJN13_05725 [Bacilli bacterium]|nr:hypothetical protein [Bacilli bacterium]